MQILQTSSGLLTWKGSYCVSLHLTRMELEMSKAIEILQSLPTVDNQCVELSCLPYHQSLEISLESGMWFLWNSRLLYRPCEWIWGKTAILVPDGNCEYLSKFSIKSVERSTKSGPCTNRPVSCRICKTVLWSYNLPIHYRVKHGDHPIPTRIRQEERNFMGIDN